MLRDFCKKLYIFLFIFGVLAIKYWPYALAIGAVLVFIFLVMLNSKIDNTLEKSASKRSGKPSRHKKPLRIDIEIKGTDFSKNRSPVINSNIQSPSLSSRSSLKGLLINTSLPVPTRGLVIGEKPLQKILSGKKTLELRGKPNRKLGPVALIRKGSGKIYAVAEISESIGPMSFEEFLSPPTSTVSSPQGCVRFSRAVGIMVGD